MFPDKSEDLLIEICLLSRRKRFSSDAGSDLIVNITESHRKMKQFSLSRESVSAMSFTAPINRVTVMSIFEAHHFVAGQLFL